MAYPSAMLEYAARIETALEDFIATVEGPDALREAMSYSLLGGGKRLRPALLLAVRGLFSSGAPEPMPTACALELVHTYSLIHDDLPAMDNDDLRRGRPSCHVRFGEAFAILAGDALLTEAFALVSRDLPPEHAALGLRIVREITAAAGAGGMIGGQVLDIQTTETRIGRAELEHLHRLKTGRLFRVAARCGALLGGADTVALDAVTLYADRVGLAFQVADDILDVTATTEALGKTAGKDARQEKNTYVSLLGLAGARGLAEQLRGEAVEALSSFGPKAETLRELAAFTVERTI